MSISAKAHTLPVESTIFSRAETNVEQTEFPGRPSYRSDTTAVGAHPDGKDQRVPRTFVPPTNEHRCLILCFDGTNDQFDADNSNIVQLVSALKKDDHTKQMVYYQSGIGTYTAPKFGSLLTTKISLILDSMVAWNLNSHVMAGYEFLMQNYTANDRICIFGFSRGAYIARSLAGMIHAVGLLPVDNHQQIPFAYRIYARAEERQSNAFKKAFSNDVPIEFIGVWDTVDSVGGFIPRRLPFTRSNTIIRTFRHAVSLDEHRVKFKPNLWHQPKKLGIHTPPARRTLRTSPKIPGHRSTLASQMSTEPDGIVDKTKANTIETTSADPHRTTRPTDISEVWFAGCHCDVGGGSVKNDTRHCLARIPLRWMIRECFKADTGMIFDAQRLHELGLDPATLCPIVAPRPPPLPVGTAKLESIPPRTSEEEEDLRDALCPIYDSLELKPVWWILELIPWITNLRYVHYPGLKIRIIYLIFLSPNLGRPRKIPHKRHDADPMVNCKVHRSVKTRLAARDAEGRCYVNRAQFHCEPDWVD
ncbi:hypothetical protein C8R44DRAFT_620488 [Mycena epipterygia]|nr:hypothetical protein C8R44DRAFT_620488 [Mycena epipterygia]